MAHFANERSLAVIVRLRPIIILAGAIFVLKILHGIARFSKFILRGESPPQFVRKLYHEAEQRVLHSLRATTESILDGEVFRKTGLVNSTPAELSLVAGPRAFAPFMESSPSAHRRAASPMSTDSHHWLSSITAVPDSDLTDAPRNDEDDDGNGISEESSPFRLSSTRPPTALPHTGIMPEHAVMSFMTREYSISSTNHCSSGHPPSQEDNPEIINMDELKRIESSPSYPGKFPV